jgi:IclR family transcriptional regulator, KDG regulon repressor
MITDINLTDAPKTLIQSLDRGLQLLEILSYSAEPLGLPELADQLDVDRSTIHRLMATLLQRGFVNQDLVTKKYTIGYKVVELSRRAIDSFSLRVACKPFMKLLVEETHESVNLAVLAGKDAICIDHESSPSPLAVTNDIGSVFHLQATALGKTFLAFLPDEARKELLAGIRFEAYTPRTIINLQALENNLQQIRQQYFALDDEERYIGVRCLAAPIFDYRKKIIAGIGISGPTTRVTLEKVGELSILVKKVAFEISVQMGYPPTDPFH